MSRVWGLVHARRCIYTYICIYACTIIYIYIEYIYVYVYMYVFIYSYTVVLHQVVDPKLRAAVPDAKAGRQGAEKWIA